MIVKSPHRFLNRLGGALLSLTLTSGLVLMVPLSGPVFAQEKAANAAEEKDAFDSAKELGTLEAWEAFLKAYPSGFYGDLARAYVRKIGTSKATTTPAAPASKPRTTAVRQPRTTPRLSTYASEAESSAWFTTRYEMDEGNASAWAAAVRAGGLELLFHCNGTRRLGGILRESSRGRYPKFDERVRQGLTARRGGRDQGSAQIPMRFSNGSIYSVAANVMEMNGEVSLDDNAGENGFRYSSGVIGDIMGASTVSIEAPPFAATFQLRKSRKAICEIANKCGASVSVCKSSYGTARKKYKGKKRKRTAKKKRTYTCSAGKTWNGTNCVQNPYLDKKGRPLDGYVVGPDGKVYQDNGGGE
jgi:hypothetical protein